MANSVRAELSESVKRNELIKVAVVGTIALLGIVLAFGSLFSARFVSAIVYLVAFGMGMLYAIMKINYTRVPSIECNGEKLVLNTWENGILPYRIDFKPQFFADFFPAKSVTYDIPMSEISDLAIGTKGFLSKTFKSRELDNSFDLLSKQSKRIASYIKRCDIFCVRLKDDTIYMMSVKSFDTDKLYEVVDRIEHCVSGLEFKTSIRKLRKKRETI